MPLIRKTKSMIQTDTLAGVVLLKDAWGRKRERGFQRQKKKHNKTTKTENSTGVKKNNNNPTTCFSCPTDTFMCHFNIPIHNTTDDENVHTSCQSIAVWTCLLFSNTLTGQISCSYSPSDDTTENSSVNGNTLQFMSRRIAISTIVFSVLNIH